MSWFTNLLRETVTYWDEPSRTGLGEYVWTQPITLDGRWQDSASVVYDQAGAYLISSAYVWVHYPIAEGGYFLNGSYSSDPPDEARQVVSVDSMLSLYDKTVTYYKAYLK